MRRTKWKHTHKQHTRRHQHQTIVNNLGAGEVWDVPRSPATASRPGRNTKSTWNGATAKTEEERSETSILSYFLEVKQLVDSAHLLPVVSVAVKYPATRYNVRNIAKGYLKGSWQRGARGEQPGPGAFVFYMSLLAGCRWVQAVGLTPLATRRTSPPPSPLTMGPRRLNSAAKPSSCRFGCRCAILVFGRCVFREQVMSHSACSSAWTRGNPGNSGCRSRTAAGLAGVWWVHRQLVAACVLSGGNMSKGIFVMLDMTSYSVQGFSVRKCGEIKLLILMGTT